MIPKGEDMIDKLFIYGSLGEGMIHHKVIKDSIVRCIPAEIRGSAYRLNVGYPVYLNEGDGVVKGYLVELKPSEILAAMLDEFYGVNHRQPNRSVHERMFTQVLVDNSMLEAQVYALRPKKLPKDAVLITDGNWEADFDSQKPLEDRFSEEEIQYIEKIGKTTGREVIPYTPMTRQLEKQGIVVDKGRRPALTPYGKEIFKYLGL